MTRTLSAALVTLGDPGKLTGGYLYHLRMAEAAPRHAAKLDFVSFPDVPFPFAAAAFPSVRSTLNRLHPTVVVVDSIAAAFLGAWPRITWPHLPLAGMLHQPPGGIDYSGMRRSIQAVLDRRAYDRMQLLMIASEALREELVDAGLPASKMVVVPPGRDVAGEIGPHPRDLRLGRNAALLAVGNWVERKGILPLLDAFSQLPEPSATLHLAGDTKAETRYGRLVAQRIAHPELQSRVVVHGKLSREDVAALYAAADVFVLPSVQDPFGTVYGEAMAFGLPVAGYRAGNLPNLAENEVEGLLVEPSDVQGLARALLRLSRDEPLRQRLGEAGRVRAQTRPTWDESAALFFDTLRAIAS